MSDLICRSKLIKSIVEVSTSPLNEWDTMGVLKIVNEQPSVTDTNVCSKWIPCSERLPNKEGFYLVTYIEEGKPYTKHVYRMMEKWLFDKEFYGEIIAWQPLPQPYKGE